MFDIRWVLVAVAQLFMFLIIQLQNKNIKENYKRIKELQENDRHYLLTQERLKQAIPKEQEQKTDIDNEEDRYIIHRTLRHENKETYIGEDRHNTYFEVVELADNTTARINTTYNREKAKLFTKDGAIKVRDRLNKNREGKTNVWSITKYEV